jgi:Holliday junction resolvase RusA-like endonuclease
MKKIPTVTHQEKKVRVLKGKPQYYEPEELKAARMKFRDYFAPYVPKEKYTGAIRLLTKWCFPCAGTKHTNGEWKITKPDTDNMVKLPKDVMTELGFWKDDAQVTSEITEKFWANTSGLYVEITEL